MKKPFDSKTPEKKNAGDTDIEPTPSGSEPARDRDTDFNLHERLIGLGERSIKKTWYSELKRRRGELERFRALVDDAGDAIFVIEGIRGIVTDVNKTALRLLGLSERQVQGKEFSGFFPDEMHEIVEGFVREKAMTRTASPIETEIRLETGGHTPVEFNLSLHEYQGKDYATVVVRDISRRKVAENALKESRERFSSLFEQSPVAMQMYDADGLLIQVNRAWRSLWDRRGAPVLGSYNLLKDKQVMDVPELAAFVETVFNGGRPPSVEHEYVPELSGWEGRPRRLRSSAYPVMKDEGELRMVVVINEDITRDRIMEDQIEHLSFHDPLTGLANRTLILHRIADAVGRKRAGAELSVLYLNVDRFKVINDSMGHDCGDMVLKEIGKRLSGQVREMDTVARLGADEFVVLLEELPSLRMTVQVVKRIRNDLVRPFFWHGRPLYLTASIGMELHPAQSERAEDVIRNAGLALHRAKERGGNRFKAFTPGLLNKAMTRMTLESDMTTGIANEEFYLQFQPIFHRVGKDAKVEGLCGLEALCRWNHPERGFVSPGEFIPIAEDTGKIIELGRFVLEKSLKSMVKWQKTYPQASELVVSVNVSPIQLARPGFTDFVSNVLEGVGVPGKNLRLEVTETALMQSGDDVLHTMQALKKLGVTFSVDDFGTGYSNMNYLTRLPLDSLKIDLSFVRFMDVKPEYAAVVKGITDLAHSLGLKVVAEGVETERQLEMLTEIGCECFQGYLFSRPLSETDIAGLIRARL